MFNISTAVMRPVGVLIVIASVALAISWRLGALTIGRSLPPIIRNETSESFVWRHDEPATLTGPAQRAVLVEKDVGSGQGKAYDGSVHWRTEAASSGPGLPPDFVVRADMEIPDRHMAVTWWLRRNTDRTLPVSHTVEIMFALPDELVVRVPVIGMKAAERSPGVPLAGLAVKVISNYFVMGLSAVDADVQRNVGLLQSQPWLEIPFVRSDGHRAVLDVAKGPAGDRAFAEAFAAWAK